MLYFANRYSICLDEKKKKASCSHSQLLVLLVLVCFYFRQDPLGGGPNPRGRPNPLGDLDPRDFEIFCMLLFNILVFTSYYYL